MNPASPLPPHRDRRGNAAATVAALIPVMGFLALVVDIGLLQATQTELQAGVDAAALAGTGYLDGTRTGLETARKMAVSVAAQNTVRGKPIQLDATQDVLLGYYDGETGKFVESADPEEITAVYVEKDVNDVATHFASAAFGERFMKTRAHALSNRTDSGVGKAACYLPIAIPDCYFDGSLMPFAARMTSAQNDNAGWSDLAGNPSAATITSQLTGKCTGGVAGVGDPVYLNNGQIASVVDKIDDLLEASTTRWNTAKLGPQPLPHFGSTLTRYGNVIEGPVIIFHPAGGVCGASTQFNQKAPIVGFAWATIYDVREHGNDKTMWMYVDPTYGKFGGLEGGGFEANYSFSEVGLVY